jgi:hypothetical protein
LNNLETLSLITQTITIFCGLFFILDISVTTVIADNTQSSSSTTGGKNSNANTTVALSENVKLLFFAVIVIANGIFFSYWAFEFIREMSTMLIMKFGKFYTIVMLCGNTKKYQKVRR